MDKWKLLGLRNALTVVEAAQLLTRDKVGCKAAESLIIEAIEAGVLTANITRWGRYVADLGTELPDGNINQRETTVKRRHLDAWLKRKGLSIDVPAEEKKPPSISKAPPPITPIRGSGTAETNNAEGGDYSANDWRAKAKEEADRIGLERWTVAQIKQITARNIAAAVAEALAKDATTHGNQGPRGEDNVRNEGLRTWKFKPPKEG